MRESDTELGRLVKSYYDKGALVPDDVTIRMILERLEQPDCESGVLLDGFPRTLEQAKALDQALSDKGKHVDQVIGINVSENELIRRLGGRWLCRKCGASYHVVSAPPKQSGVCDLDGTALYQRPDDNEETAKNRLKVYVDQTKPLEDYYKGQGKLVSVDGEQSIDSVQEAILDALKVA